mgnify:CR=1 FL=1
MKQKRTPVEIGTILYKITEYDENKAVFRVTKIEITKSEADKGRTFFRLDGSDWFSSCSGSFPDEEQALTVETEHIAREYVGDRKAWLEIVLKNITNFAKYLIVYPYYRQNERKFYF